MADEIEVLQSIYGEELVVLTSSRISIVCKPAAEPSFVSAVLEIELLPGALPAIEIPDCFGLDEKERQELLGSLGNVLSQSTPEDQPCFELIERLRGDLEDMNSNAMCHICLAPLREAPPRRTTVAFPLEPSSPWARTPCRHQYHSPCLGRWWQTVVVSKSATRSKRGGDSEETGREKSAQARLRVLEQALEAAHAEEKSAKTTLAALVAALADSEAQAGRHTSKRAGAQRAAEALKTEAELEVLRNEVRLAEQRSSQSQSSKKVCQDRTDAAAAALVDAQVDSTKAAARDNGELVGEIPCPVCRSSLRLQDAPFDPAAFGERALEEAASAAAVETAADQAAEEPRLGSASCREHLSPDLLAIVRATQEEQGKLKKQAWEVPSNRGFSQLGRTEVSRP